MVKQKETRAMSKNSMTLYKYTVPADWSNEKISAFAPKGRG